MAKSLDVSVEDLIMEGEKYNVAKAQEEADKLRRKVKAGEASNYKEAEEIVTSEEIKSIWYAKEEMKALLKKGHYLGSVVEIKERFNLSDEAVQSAAKEGMMSLLKSGNIDSAIKIKERFNLSGEIIQSPEIQSVAKERMMVLLKSGDIESAIKIKERFNLSGEIIQSPEIQSAAKEGMMALLKQGHYLGSVVKIKERFNLSDEAVQSVAKEGIMALLKEGHYIESVVEIKERFNLSDEAVQSAAKEGIVTLLKTGYRSYLAVEIKERLNLPDGIIQSPEIQSAAKEGIVALLKSGDIESAIKIKERFNLSGEIIQSPEIQSAAKEGMMALLKQGHYLGSVVKIKERFNLSDDIFQSSHDQEVLSAISLFTNLDIGAIGYFDNDRDDISEEAAKNLFAIAKIELPQFQSEYIASAFQAGAETFGYKRMAEYIRRKNLSPHDAVHAFGNILELFRASGIGESEFYGQVLQQVKMDDREYPEGTAHHHLNAIAQTANKNVGEIIAKAQEYKEFERLQELVETFSSPQTVFASWNNLKRYSKLEQLLGQSEIFDELKELKANGKEALCKYVETLAFHPDSKVNMSSVIQFWRDPESFLAAGASHTPDEIHDRKKPSNYLQMPNLDLTATELRDALVEGKMDGLSVFTPLEIRYTIPLEDMMSEPLPDLARKALGSSKKGIEGAARNARKLFSELGKLFKPYGISVADYIQDKPFPKGVNLSQEIEALLYNRDFGMEKPLVKTREFVARISQKSDPEGAIAGDDTVNCMPFGDGKNTVYTFNPNTAQFVIRAIKGDGKERTIAQSVLTKDMDIQILVPDVISELQQEGGHLEDVLPADILRTASAYAACDNVEVAPNYSDERYQQIIEAIFRDFFMEYMSRYAETEELNPKKIPIGQGFTDTLSHLPTETNTFAPQAPVSYSDKMGGNVYMLDLESKAGLDLIVQKQVQEIKVKRHTESAMPKVKGLRYLTFEDTLKAAYIEGKAYSDNQSLMQFLFNMENGLIAKDINNAAKDRPNMSLTYTDEDGRMRGYMLAWEGRLSDENIEYNAREFFNQSCIYIADIATDRESRMAGGRLVQGFAELYKQNYLDKGKRMPIYAQARETTSYQIIKRQLDNLGKDAGFDFELIELPTYEAGEDVMHPIIIRPVGEKK